MSARESITLNAELYDLKERLSFGEIRYGEVDAVGDGGGFYTDIEVPVHVDAVEVGTVRISANVYYHSDPLDKAPGKVLFQINGYVVDIYKRQFTGNLPIVGAENLAIYMARNHVKDRDVVTHVDWALFDTLAPRNS
jgi:hypothetical protein